MSSFPSLLGYVNRDTFGEIANLGLLPKEQIQLTHSLMSPQTNYYLRVNLTKISKSGFIERMRLKNTEIIDIPSFPEVVGIRVQPGTMPPPRGRVVYAYKFAAESVFTGAHLYYPGIGPNSHVPLGVSVEIREWKRKIHVASGTTRMNLKNPPSRVGLAVENVTSPHVTWAFHESEEYAAGLFDDQSLPPVAVAHAVMNEYRKGLRILDLCAAPGGKSTAMAQIGKCQFGEWPDILAIDRSQNRLNHLAQKITRLGLQGINALAMKLEHVHERYPEWKGQGDLVLLDPPCSALGTRPKIYIDTLTKDYHNFAENQFRLLQHAWELVKPGGILVYSTCSITTRENEGNVARVLDTFDAELLPAGINIGHPGLPYETLSLTDVQKLRRFWPHRDDCIGYFIAKFRRVS